MKITQISFKDAMNQTDNPYLYRICLCDDSNYGHSGHLSARMKLAKRCTVEELVKCKTNPMYAFVLIEPDEVV